MKITREQLKQIIKEELEAVVETKQLKRGPTFDIQDAIQMLEAEEDTTGTLFHVINRLYAALDKLGVPDGEERLEEGGYAGHYTGGGKSAGSQLSGIGFEIDGLINKTPRLLIDTEMDADMRSTAIDIVDHIRDDVKKRYRQLAYYVQGATKKGPSAKEKEIDEASSDKKSPDDIVARFPSSRPGEPDQVIYRWQQEEFDERERALKAFNKRKKK